MEKAREEKDLSEKVKCLEKEIEKYKKIIVMQQDCLFNNSKLETFQRCFHCDKVFVNESFLRSHIRRKHGLSPVQYLDSEENEKPRMVDQETQTSGQFNRNELLSESFSSLILGSNKSKSWPDIGNDFKDPKQECENDVKKKRKSLKGKKTFVWYT